MAQLQFAVPLLLIVPVAFAHFSVFCDSRDASTVNLYFGTYHEAAEVSTGTHHIKYGDTHMIISVNTSDISVEPTPTYRRAGPSWSWESGETTLPGRALQYITAKEFAADISRVFHLQNGKLLGPEAITCYKGNGEIAEAGEFPQCFGGEKSKSDTLGSWHKVTFAHAGEYEISGSNMNYVLDDGQMGTVCAFQQTAWSCDADSPCRPRMTDQQRDAILTAALVVTAIAVASATTTAATSSVTSAAASGTTGATSATTSAPTSATTPATTSPDTTVGATGDGATSGGANGDSATSGGEGGGEGGDAGDDAMDCEQEAEDKSKGQQVELNERITNRMNQPDGLFRRGRRFFIITMANRRSGFWCALLARLFSLGMGYSSQLPPDHYDEDDCDLWVREINFLGCLLPSWAFFVKLPGTVLLKRDGRRGSWRVPTQHGEKKASSANAACLVSYKLFAVQIDGAEEWTYLVRCPTLGDFLLKNGREIIAVVMALLLYAVMRSPVVLSIALPVLVLPMMWVLGWVVSQYCPCIKGVLTTLPKEFFVFLKVALTLYGFIAILFGMPPMLRETSFFVGLMAMATEDMPFLLTLGGAIVISFLFNLGKLGCLLCTCCFNRCCCRRASWCKCCGMSASILRFVLAVAGLAAFHRSHELYPAALVQVAAICSLLIADWMSSVMESYEQSEHVANTKRAEYQNPDKVLGKGANDALLRDLAKLGGWPTDPSASEFLGKVRERSKYDFQDMPVDHFFFLHDMTEVCGMNGLNHLRLVHRSGDASSGLKKYLHSSKLAAGKSWQVTQNDVEAISQSRNALV